MAGLWARLMGEQIETDIFFDHFLSMVHHLAFYTDFLISLYHGLNNFYVIMCLKMY